MMASSCSGGTPVACSDGSCVAIGSDCIACPAGTHRANGKCYVDSSSHWNVIADSAILGRDAACPNATPGAACNYFPTSVCLTVAGAQQCTAASAATNTPSWMKQLFARAAATALTDPGDPPAMNYFGDGRVICDGAFVFLDSDFQRGAAKVVCNIDPNTEVQFDLEYVQ